MTLSTRIDRLKAGTAKAGCLFNPMGGQVRRQATAIRQALHAIPGLMVREAQDALTFKSAIEELLQADIDLLVSSPETAPRMQFSVIYLPHPHPPIGR